MSSNHPLVPSEVVRQWHQAAADYDYLSSVPEVNAFYAQRNWRESDYQNILKGFARRRDDHRAFLEAFPYGWAVERDAYEYSVDAVYQLQAIDVIAGIWHDCDEETRRLPDFDNICVRQTRRWGSPADISPLAVPAKPLSPIKFILVPFGWDNFVSLTVEGFAEHSPCFFEHPLGDLSSHTKTLLPACSDKKVAYWKSLAVCSLVSILGCPEILVPAAEELLIEQIPEFQGAKKYLDGHSDLNRRLAYSQAVVVYSIAHEVGHHLNAVYSDAKSEDREYVADALAYRGIWNYPAVIGTVSPEGETYDAMTLLAGGLFTSVIDFGLASDRIVREISEGSLSQPSTYVSKRKQQWQLLSERIVSRCPELRKPWQGIQVMLDGFDDYQASYLDYLKSVVSSKLDRARVLIQELLSKNPNLDDPAEVARRFRDEVMNQTDI